MRTVAVISEKGATAPLALYIAVAAEFARGYGTVPITPSAASLQVHVVVRTSGSGYRPLRMLTGMLSLPLRRIVVPCHRVRTTA
jgi:hypothetical protein